MNRSLRPGDVCRVLPSAEQTATLHSINLCYPESRIRRISDEIVVVVKLLHYKRVVHVMTRSGPGYIGRWALIRRESDNSETL